MIPHLASLRIILGLLATYHLGIGVVSSLSLGWTAKVSKGLYAIQLGSSPQLRYTVKMLGLYALTLGALLAYAAWHPLQARPIILAIIGLQTLRAIWRIAYNRLVTEAFGITTARNLFNAGLLIAEIAWLAACFPRSVA